MEQFRSYPSELKKLLLSKIVTVRKVPRYGAFSSPYFPVFGLNTEIYRVNLRIQSKYGKIRTRKNSVFGLFSRSAYLKFVRPSPSNLFDCNNYKGIRLITQLRVGMSHLREHKFKHNSQDCLNPICSCGLHIESTSHFLLHCPSFNDKR